ncbi:DNA-binding protein [Paeniglutamicibacter gangotriensis]|uniref:DNA-binding protein n=1 Tax=Paeniglutamicibacter gangotriensis TaxID=254787 RepID=UPI0037C8ADCD
MEQHPTSSPSPAQRAADASAQMDASGAKVTVSAVRARAGVSMEAARLGVEQWRTQSRQPEIPMPENVQRIFASAWATAVSDADARYQSDREAARELVAAAAAEAQEAGKLVDTEAARAEAEKERAIAAEQEVARLRGQLTEEAARHQGERRLAAEALETEQTRTQEAREALAEARGALAILQEQAALYWNKTETQKK